MQHEPANELFTSHRLGCMPLASCQGRLTIYSREMVNIPRDKLGGIVMPSALCRILRPEWGNHILAQGKA